MDFRLRLYTWMLLIAIALTLNPIPTYSYVPSVKYQTVTWVDDDAVWIFDVSISTESPWRIGRLATISIVATLRSSPPGRSLYVISRLFIDNNELSSRYVGELSAGNRVATGVLYVVVSSKYFGESRLEPTFTRVLKVVIEGFRGGKVFRYELELPVTIATEKTLLTADVAINNHPNYYLMFEALTRTNITVTLRNQGLKDVAWVIAEVYLNDELVGRRYVDGLKAGEVKAIDVTVFRYFTPGLYTVRTSLRYALPEGVEEYVSVYGILEVVRSTKVTLGSDKSSVIEGSEVVFQGRVIPGSETLIILETLIGRSWVPVDVVKSRSDGSFNFTWIARDLDPNIDYAEYVFRARMPISAIGANVSVTSEPVSVIIYNSRRITEFVGDVRLSLDPEDVIRGANTTAKVTISPVMPICVPVKLVYQDLTTYTWFELDTLYVCGSEGVKVINVMLPPGTYAVKAMIVSKYRSVESLPKPLRVIEVPKLLINTPKTLIYGSNLTAVVRLEPALLRLVSGYVSFIRGDEVLRNVSVTLVDGVAEAGVKNVIYEGILMVRACINLASLTLCNETEVNVVKPTINVSPSSIRTEVGSTLRYSITVLPQGKYDLSFIVASATEVVHAIRIWSDDFGRASLDVTAPSRPGSYTVTVSIYGTQISTTARLDVIEFIRSVNLELLNKSVKTSERVYARITLQPAPTVPQQVVINIQRNGVWEPISYYAMTSATTTISFIAPATEGQYRVKASVLGTNVESNVEVLNVLPTVATVIPTEYSYIILASAVGGAILLYMMGRRKR